jgi:hypothetical protein
MVSVTCPSPSHSGENIYKWRAYDYEDNSSDNSAIETICIVIFEDLAEQVDELAEVVDLAEQAGIEQVGIE